MCNPQDDIGYPDDFIEPLKKYLDQAKEMARLLEESQILYLLKDITYCIEELEEFINNHMELTGK